MFNNKPEVVVGLGSFPIMAFGYKYWFAYLLSHRNRKAFNKIHCDKMYNNTFIYYSLLNLITNDVNNQK